MAVVPIAVTSGDVLNATIGILVTLNGSGSYDPNGGTITSYIWTVSDKPPGSVVTLTSSNTVSPTFTPDVVGTYRFFLRVISNTGSSSESDESLAPTTAFSNISVPTTNKSWIIPATGQREWGDYLYTILVDADEFVASGGAVTSVNEVIGDVVVDLNSVLTAGNVASGKIIKIPQILGIPASIVDADGEDLTLQGGSGNGDGNGGNLYLKGGVSPGAGTSGNIIIDNVTEFQIQAALTTLLTLSVDDYISISSRATAPINGLTLWSSDGTSDQWNQHLYWNPVSGQSVDLIRPSAIYSQFICNSFVAVGDLVYIDGSGVCQKALANDLVTSNVVGFVLEKKSSTVCFVATYGEITLSSLIIGSRYYLSDTIAGGITLTQPIDVGTYVATVGIAISTTKLIIQIWPPIGN